MFIIAYVEGRYYFSVVSDGGKYDNGNQFTSWIDSIERLKLDWDKIFTFETMKQARNMINEQAIHWGDLRNIKVKKVEWLKRRMIQEALR